MKETKNIKLGRCEKGKSIELNVKSCLPCQFTTKRTEMGKRDRFKKGRDYTSYSKEHQKHETKTNNKSNCVISTTDFSRNVLVGNEEDIDNLKIRRLTPIECERLQTVPDNYTNHVSNSQRYKMLGNGWTVDVIVHILKHMEL